MRENKKPAPFLREERNRLSRPEGAFRQRNAGQIDTVLYPLQTI
jgi:hypothetical protein